MRRYAWLLPLFLVPPAAQAKLELVKVEPTYGLLWPERKTLNYYPPEDLIYFRCCVAGQKLKHNGAINVALASTLTDAHGKVVLSSVIPLTADKIGLLGRGPRWFSVGLLINTQLPAGEYTFHTTFTDNLAKESVSFDRKVRMCPGELALQSAQFFADPERKIPAPARISVAQTLNMRLVICGIQVKDQKLDLAMKSEVIDAQTQEVLCTVELPPLQDPRAIRNGFIDLNDIIPAFNGTGRLLYRLTITDRIANKTLHYEVPVEVYAP